MATTESTAGGFNPIFSSQTRPEPRQNVAKRDSIFTLVFLLLVSLFISDAHADGTRERLIKVTTVKEGKCTRFLVENLQMAPVTVTFELELTNLRQREAGPLTFTLQGASSREVFSLEPAKEDADSKWSYTYHATWGTLDAKHMDSYVYWLPYSPGKAYEVSQGFNGAYSHFGSDQYAIDWRMPIGTPVHASRGGRVVGAKDDSNLGGGDKKFEWDANYILIQHADGTLGHYVHLMKGGNKVQVGDAVKPGQCIALSGNTGHSTGPHLHFAVFKAADGKHRQTIAVKYRTTNGAPVGLREGRAYRALTFAQGTAPGADNHHAHEHAEENGECSNVETGTEQGVTARRE